MLTAPACVRPKPRASVTVPPGPGASSWVATMWPSGADVYGVSAWDVSSWVRPSLAVPA